MSDAPVDPAVQRTVDLAVLSERVNQTIMLIQQHHTDVTQGFLLVRDDIRTSSAAVSKAVGDKLDAYVAEHQNVHAAHILEHQSSNTRFWAAAGLLAAGITTLAAIVADKLNALGSVSSAILTPFGMFGVTALGGTLLAILLKEKILFAIGGVVGKWRATHRKKL